VHSGEQPSHKPLASLPVNDTPCNDRIQHGVNGFTHVLNQNRMPSFHGPLHDSDHVIGPHANNLRVSIASLLARVLCLVV
jgi:hypothetical protein